MDLKKLIDHRNDILFAEIGALIHDLGKLSKEFILQSAEDNYNFFYKHSLIFGRDFLNASQEDLYNKTDEELSQIIEQINQRIGNGSFTKFSHIINYIRTIISEITSRKQAERFIDLLKSKYSKDDLWISIENFLNQKIEIEIEDKLLQFSIIDIISKHHEEKKYITEESIKLIHSDFGGADGVDSGIDKMVTDVTYSKQLKNHVFISTAFGYEDESQKINLDLPDTDERSLTKIRENYANKLANILEDPKNNSSGINNWIEKRDRLLQATKKAFLNALGETRRPANDVTLWDHSYSVASLYKAALAEVIINGWKAPKDIKWKLLGIRFNGDEFYNHVPKITDVLGRKQLVGKILDTIKDMFEVLIPVGNEIYRDENGSVFLVSESANENIFELNDDVWDDIKSTSFDIELNYIGKWNSKKLEDIINPKPNNLKELIEKLSSFISSGSFIPEIAISSPSRGAVNLGDKILNKNSNHTFDIERLKSYWENKSKNYEKCSICGLKPVSLNYKEFEEFKNKNWEELTEEQKLKFENNKRDFIALIKAFERKVCLDCLKLSQNRVQEWWENIEWNIENPENPSKDTSIWLGEIVDENNRIGLVYLSFDLDRWLNGEMLNTFFSKPFLIDEFKNKFPEINQLSNYEEFIRVLKECFKKDDFSHELPLTKSNGTKIKVKEILERIIFIGDERNPNEVFDSIVSNREPDWQDKYPVPDGATKGDNTHKAAVFLLLSTRKHPSFARLRRIWETTKRFGVEIIKETKNNLSQRERSIFDFVDNGANLKETHTYGAKLQKDGKEYRFEIVVARGNKAAVISASENLHLSQNDVLTIFDESFKEQYGIVIISSNPQLEPYKPIIPYQNEPTKTMFFMPLKEVWKVINSVKKKYEIEFSKVQNRLPIKLGFIAFHKRTSMYVVLDSVSRLLSKESEEKIFKVRNITELGSQKNCFFFEGKIGNKVKEMQLLNHEEKKDLNIYVSYSTGDPNKEDLFHPYFIVKNHNGWKVSYGNKWESIKYVKQVAQDDKVYFYPSYFDFLYLDTNTRRLDAGKNRRHWLFKEVSPKPYLLQDIDNFNRLKELLLNKLKLTTSQLLNFYSLLIEKIQMWEIDKTEILPINDSTFKELVENTILDVPLRLKIKDETKKGQITKDDFNFLKQNILSGLFFDFIDMWHTILKHKFN